VGGGDVGEKVSRETHLLIEIRNQNLICGCSVPARKVCPPYTRTVISPKLDWDGLQADSQWEHISYFLDT
jgi:hypothetical protein